MDSRLTITGIGSVDGNYQSRSTCSTDKWEVGIGTTRSVQVTEDGGIELVRYPKAEDWWILPIVHILILKRQSDF